jgi:hypothetical protein
LEESLNETTDALNQTHTSQTEAEPELASLRDAHSLLVDRFEAAKRETEDLRSDMNASGSLVASLQEGLAQSKASADRLGAQTSEVRLLAVISVAIAAGATATGVPALRAISRRGNA